ncbi:MAG: tetratricopeptide repeat protein [Endomicrobia bacterium]|nr:tetratricopeptide repeat protein [Endomicrobiia bacterium]
MKIKNIICALLILSLCGVGAYARPQKRESSSEQFAAPAVDKKASRQQNKRYAVTDLSKVEDYYFAGKLDKAELMLNEILLTYPDNTEALELKNKILIVKEKLFVFKRDAAEDYLVESERSLRDGNYYEGLLYYKRAVDLMPEIYDAQKYNTMIGVLNAQALRYKGSDRKAFLLSVEAFQDGDFKKAKSLIEYLSQRYENMLDYRGMVDFYQVEYTNRERTQAYFREALSNFKQGRYENARSALNLAMALNPKDLDIALLSEQINLELQ